MSALLARGAAVNPKDAKGFTPLHYATDNGHKKVAKMLKKQGGEY